MPGLAIQELMGVNKHSPTAWLGMTEEGQRVWIEFDHGVLTVRVASQGDPRTGLVVLSQQIWDRNQRQLSDSGMVQYLERVAGYRFAAMDGRRIVGP